MKGDHWIHFGTTRLSHRPSNVMGRRTLRNITTRRSSVSFQTGLVGVIEYQTSVLLPVAHLIIHLDTTLLGPLRDDQS
jgi:hypothetical protein